MEHKYIICHTGQGCLISLAMLIVGLALFCVLLYWGVHPLVGVVCASAPQVVAAYVDLAVVRRRQEKRRNRQSGTT